MLINMLILCIKNKDSGQAIRSNNNKKKVLGFDERLDMMTTPEMTASQENINNSLHNSHKTSRRHVE